MATSGLTKVRTAIRNYITYMGLCGVCYLTTLLSRSKENVSRNGIIIIKNLGGAGADVGL
jgi:hypothetical protein